MAHGGWGDPRGARDGRGALGGHRDPPARFEGGVTDPSRRAACARTHLTAALAETPSGRGVRRTVGQTGEGRERTGRDAMEWDGSGWDEMRWERRNWAEPRGAGRHEGGRRNGRTRNGRRAGAVPGAARCGGAAMAASGRR